MLDKEQAVMVAKTLGMRDVCECKPYWFRWRGNWVGHYHAVTAYYGCPWCLARLLPDGYTLPEDWRERLAERMGELWRAGWEHDNPEDYEFAMVMDHTQKPGSQYRWQACFISPYNRAVNACGQTPDLALVALLEQSASWETKEENDSE